MRNRPASPENHHLQFGNPGFLMLKRNVIGSVGVYWVIAPPRGISSHVEDRDIVPKKFEKSEGDSEFRRRKWLLSNC
jgi:hypothetical protein